jgi:hypothetical protein
MTAIQKYVAAAVCAVMASAVASAQYHAQSPASGPAATGTLLANAAAARPAAASVQPASPVAAGRQGDRTRTHGPVGKRQDRLAWQEDYKRQMVKSQANMKAFARGEKVAKKNRGPYGFTDQQLYESINAPTTLHRVP